MKQKPVQKKNFCTLADLNDSELHRLIDLAEECEKYVETGTIPGFAPKRRVNKRVLSGLSKGTKPAPFTVAIDMKEASTRTKNTTEIAALRMGCQVTVTSDVTTSSVIKGEGPAHDMMMVACNQYPDIYATRTPYEGSAKYAMELIAGFHQTVGGIITPRQCAVIGLGDGSHGHVTQGVLDLKFLRRHFGRLDRFTLGIVGGYLSRTTAELLRGAAICGYKVRLFCLPEHQPAGNLLKGVDYTIHNDWDGIGDCDAINWVRPQDERAADPLSFMRLMQHYRHTPKVAAKLKSDVIHLHAQPIKDTGDLLTVFPGMYHLSRYQSIQQQALGALATRMAFIKTCLENLDLPTELPRPSDLTLTKHQLQPAEEKYQKIMRKLKKSELAFKPIPRGMLWDHHSCQDAMIFHRWLLYCGLIDFCTPGIKAPILPLFTHRLGYDNNAKGVVICEYQKFLDVIIASFLQCFKKTTCNVITDEWFYKNLYEPLEFLSPDGILPCPNPNCISNLCQQGVTGHYFDRQGNSICRLCERPSNGEEIADKIREIVGGLIVPGWGL